MQYVFILLLLVISCAPTMKVKNLSLDEINKWGPLPLIYEYSSDVFYGVIIDKKQYREPNNCKIDYVIVKVVEEFKGRHQKDDLVTLVPIGESSINSSHLFFLEPFDVEGYPGYGICKNTMLKNFLNAHEGCCTFF